MDYRFNCKVQNLYTHKRLFQLFLMYVDTFYSFVKVGLVEPSIKQHQSHAGHSTNPLVPYLLFRYSTKGISINFFTMFRKQAKIFGKLFIKCSNIH